VGNIKTRLAKIEKKRGKGLLRVNFHILYDGETAPESKDPDAFTLIMDLGGPRPAEDSPREKH
jgi:hypothetical protein